MKRNISFPATMCMATTLTGYIGPAPAAQETEAEKVTLQCMTLADGKVLEIERYITEGYMEKNLHIVIEITPVSVLDTFITTLKAKFAADEGPGLYTSQAGTRVHEFVQAGLLEDITSEPYMKNVREEDETSNSPDGKICGVPIRYEYSDLLVNREVLADYPDIRIPASFQELVAACQSLQEQELENPMILAGESISNVAQLDFQYLACVTSHENPDYYEQIPDGELKFADGIFKKMFDRYGQLKEYVSDNALGMDDDETIERFIRDEGAFWVAHGSGITRVRELGGDELDLMIVPTVLQDENQERTFSYGQALALNVVDSSKYPDEVRDPIAEFLLPESGNITTSEGEAMPTTAGAKRLSDPCLEPCQEWFDSDRKVAHANLIWVPKIKDVMKEIAQKWYTGNSTESVLAKWDSQYHRPLEASPDFIRNFGRD